MSQATASRTVCGFCHMNCGLVVETRNGVIHKIRGDREHPGSRGVLCPKGLAAREMVYAPERLRYPLRKTPGCLKRVSWEEALDTIASRLGGIKESHGAASLVWCTGAPVSTEAAFGFVQLVAAYGSPNITGPGHLCSMPRRLALQLVYGGRSHPDYENTRCIVMWGANPDDTRQFAEGAVYGRYDRLITGARGRGARLIVIDPWRTDMAAMADEWLQIRPGTDLALGLAMLHIIIGEGLYDREFVDRWTLGFNELEEHVRQYTPSWAENITGIPAGKIQAVARTYATTRPALICDGNGLDQHPDVVETVRVLGMLSAVTGNVDVPGGDVFFPSTRFGRYLTVHPREQRLGDDRHPLFPSVPFPSVVDALLSGQPYRPRAMIVHRANPLLTNANEGRVRKALEQLEFLVVSDIFPTATAQMADVVLPDASDFERYGYQDYASAAGGFVALSRKVIEPVGESRSAFDTEYDLAGRMGLEKYYPWKNTEEWVNYRLSQAGITLDDLKEKSVIYTTPPVEYQKYLKNGFNTPSKKVELYSPRLKDHGYDPLPLYREPAAALKAWEPHQYSLMGTTRRPGNYVHTKGRNLPRLHKLQPDPLVWMHPDDARVRGIGEGDATTVASPQGNIRLAARLTGDVPRGLVFIDFGWGNPWDRGANINLLVPDDERDPVVGATSNRRFLCEVKRA